MPFAFAPIICGCRFVLLCSADRPAGGLQSRRFMAVRLWHAREGHV